MLTQKEAWLSLAKALLPQNRKDLAFSAVEHITQRKACLGLCPAIDELVETNQISDTIRKLMKSKIAKLPEIDCYRFRWPATAEGHMQRLEFCLHHATN